MCTSAAKMNVKINVNNNINPYWHMSNHKIWTEALCHIQLSSCHERNNFIAPTDAEDTISKPSLVITFNSVVYDIIYVKPTISTRINILRALSDTMIKYAQSSEQGYKRASSSFLELTNTLSSNQYEFLINI